MKICPTRACLEEASLSLSPNRNERPLGDKGIISLLVIHNISLPPNQFGTGAVHDFFLNQLDHSAHPYYKTIENLTVSAHLFIDRKGYITQFVPFCERAWHAGASQFRDRKDCNDFSIGIELEGTDDIEYTPEQYQSLSLCTKAIMLTYPEITPDRIVGHSDIAPGRKSDPGPSFDWARFRMALV